MPTDAISKANDILDIDETDTVINRRQIPSDQDIEKCQRVFTLLIPLGWLNRWRKKLKRKTSKVTFLLRELTVSEGALGFEYTGYLANIHSVKSYFDANMDMLDPQKFYSLLYANQKSTLVWRMRNRLILIKRQRWKIHSLHQEALLRDMWSILLCRVTATSRLERG